MKILHIITSLRMGGAEKLMVDLLPRLKEKKNQVDLLVFDGIRTPFYEDLEKSGIKIYYLKIGGCVYNPFYIFRLISFLKKYDIAHTHNTAPQLFAAIGSLFCSVVLVTTEHTTFNRRRNWKWYAYIDKWMYSRYKSIITISNQAEINLKLHLNSKNLPIKTIYNGIDFERFATASPNYFLRNDSRKYVVVMVAGFRYEKDQDTLIKAMKYLPLEDYELWLVGDGKRKNELIQLCQKEQVMDNVRFLGVRNDVPSILKTVDIIVMSSHFEGLSLSNIEGMSAGKPFIASDVDGLKEITKDAGILFPHGDSKALADEIMKLVDNKKYCDTIVQQCQLRARMYDITLMVDNYDIVYQSIIK